ncbi:hypothetical protein C0J52_04329 [Blattella germanica]|nr:hypothetical protein C0J52_04329 [Blattella germanica]
MKKYTVHATVIEIFENITMTSELLSAYLLLNLLQFSLGLQDPLNWWKTTTVYQIYLLSFKDSNGDGIGDLRGVISKLDYLKELGVGAVWLTPFYKSPLEALGYDITDYYSVDPVFGTMQDFDELKARLKDMDIKLILDVVPNHTSDKHPWFQQSIDRIDPYTNYYVWKDGKINEDGELEPPNNWKALFGGSAWEWNEKRGQYFLHQFQAFMPDLHYYNPDVHEEMKNVFKFWIVKGADGFRIDAMHFTYEDSLYRDEMINPMPGYTSSNYSYLIHNGTASMPETYEMMKEWRSFIDTEFNNVDNHTRILVPEVYASIEHTMAYFGNSTNPGAHFPFNFYFIDNLRMGASAWDVLSAILGWLNNLPQGMPSNWVVGNHDKHRVWNKVGGQLIDAMNMLTTLLPGTNFLYYGEELGMQNNPSGYDPSRAPFQWDNTHNAGFSTAAYTFYPVNDDYTYVNLQKEKEDARSHFHVYQSLMEARKTPTIQNGELYLNVLGNDVFSFSSITMTFEYLSAYLLLNLLQISLGLQDPLNWWKTTTIYQIYPLSFKDSNGDGIGDLQGIISKVDYLKELGVGAVWLNPFYQSPLEAYGYDITDYYSIDPVFGTIEDFDELKARLKDLDIKLILDVVPNHTSNKHPWFLQSIDRIDPYTNYYIWKDGKINENGEREPPNNWVALISGSAWQWNEKRGQYFLHQFGANMPDLNYHNPDVHDEMKNVFNYWAGKGADGFRIDAMHFMYEDALYRDEMINPEPGYSPSDYNYLIHNGTAGLPETYELMKEWRSFIDTEFNNVDNYTRILVPEAYASIEQTMEYYGNSTNPGAHFPFNFNLINYLHMGSSAWDVLSAVLDWVNNLPQGMPSNWIVGNHDQNRVWNRVGGQLVDAMNMLATLLPGTNFLYYGEEIGMQNNPSGSDPSRAPFQWDNTHNAGKSF